jgi:hypothetical protein
MAATATSQKQKEKESIPSQTLNELLQEAMASYERALKSGIQFQEESVGLWKELLSKIGSPESLKGQLELINSEVYADTRKGLDEIIATFNRSSSRTIELFRKAFSGNPSHSIKETQEQLQDLVENSLSNLHSNIQAALSMNAKILNSWKEIASNLVPSAK